MTRSCVQVLHHSTITGFGFMKCQFLDVDSVLTLLHRVDVSYVIDISEVHVASIFRVEVCRLVSFCACVYAYIQNFVSKRSRDRRGLSGDWCLI
jgi:hypothetical protein